MSPRPIPSSRRRAQGGLMLLEVLIAILIFSFGLLAIFGLQASAVRDSAHAKYRAEAILLANDLLGRMQASNRAPAALQAAFGEEGASYQEWLALAQQTLPGLVAQPPAIAPDAATGATSVDVRVRWRVPGEDPAAAPNEVRVITQIP